MKTLIITGPRDGEFTDHLPPYLAIAVPAPDGYVTINFKRVTVFDGMDFVYLFVPSEWPDGKPMMRKVFSHLLRRAFEDAEK